MCQSGGVSDVTVESAASSASLVDAELWMPSHRLRERFLHGVVTLGILDALSFVVALIDPGNNVAITVTFHGIALSLLAVVYVWARAGKVRAAGLLLIGLLWTMVTVSLVLFSSMTAVTASVYIVPVMVAGIVLGPGWALGVGALCMVTTGVVFWVDARGLLPPSLAPATKVNLYSAVGIPLIAASVLYYVLIRDLQGLAAASARLASDRLVEQEKAELRATLFSAISQIGRFALETRDMERLARFAAAKLASVVEGATVRVLLVPTDTTDLPTLVAPDGAASLDPEVEGWVTEVVGSRPGPVEWPPHLVEALFGRRPDGPTTGLAAPILLSRRPLGYVLGLPPDDPSCVPVVGPGVPLVADLLAAAYARSEAEYRMMQAQKLEVVGRLAGGVAHDFNNLLTAMRALVDDLAAEVEDRPHGRESVRLLESAIDRGALVAGQLLAVSRRPRSATGPCDVATVLRNLEPLLARLMPDECRLEVRVEGDDLWVDVDIASLEQLLLNLVVNAFEAMPDGGVVTVTADDDENGVRLRVSDTGIGMDERVRARIFDPFFTTKPDGTGLGMAIVRDITQRYGAVVNVDSEPGKGTEITLRLHRAVEAAAEGRRGEGGAHASRFDGRRVLLVDDNDLVRVGLERTFAALGFVVDAVADARTALDRIRSADPSYDLIVTDLHMPGMSGDVLAGHEMLRERGVAVIVMSGDRAPKTAVEAGGRVAFLEKPFERDALVRTIRSVLASRAAADARDAAAPE